MTIDERIARIEHISAGLDDQQRRDREEARLLWRDTQRQLGDLTLKLSDFIDETRNGEESLRKSIMDFAKEAKEADARLAMRITDLVSAIGKLISEDKK